MKQGILIYGLRNFPSPANMTWLYKQRAICIFQGIWKVHILALQLYSSSNENEVRSICKDFVKCQIVVKCKGNTNVVK